MSGSTSNGHVGVLFVHGMGNVDRDYAAPLQRRIVAELGDRAQRVAFESVHYRDPLEASQAALWSRWKEHTGGADDPDTAFLRYGLVLSGFGDVLAYVQRHRTSIHRKVAAALERLRGAVRRPARAPLCIVAHSLGTVVAEDYVRRHQGGGRALGASPFSRAETLTNFYTLGSPLPLFRLSKPLPPIDVPGRVGARASAEWVNFYSRSDVFGMPLKIMGEAYAAAVQDVRSTNRGLIDGHLGYWKNRALARRIAAGLARSL